MAYAQEEKLRNTFSSATSLGGTGAGLGFAIAGPPGAAIGGGIGLIIGGIGGFFLTDDEKNEMIEMYREGKLDDQTVANIESTIARRYNILRSQQSADFARRGVDKSSFAMRQIADTTNAERQTLAEVLTGEVERRQAIGFGLSDQASAQRAQDVASGIGALFQGYQLHEEGEAAKAEAARDERLITAIGKFLEGNDGGTPTPASPKVSVSKTGAGNPFSRHRSRAPNVSVKWDRLKSSYNAPVTTSKPKVSWGSTPKPKVSWLR